MITNSKQVWEVGRTVKVGFMVLEVIEKVPTPKDGMPDVYVLKSSKGKIYQFTPHYGLEAIGGR